MIRSRTKDFIRWQDPGVPPPPQRAVLHLSGGSVIPAQALLEAVERVRAAILSLGITHVEVKVGDEPEDTDELTVD